MTVKLCGIYQIEHRFSHKKYIGSSMDIWNRWKQHRSSLADGKHHNKQLQLDYDFYDRMGNLYIYTIVKTFAMPVPSFYLHAIEQKYIDHEKNCYNTGKPSKKSGMWWITMKIITMFD